MKSFLLPALAGAMIVGVSLAAPAHADVFSSQSFTGETTTLNNLPGVNLDATPGFGGGGNCVDSQVTSFSPRDGHQSGTKTECRVGSFTFSTVRSGSQQRALDTTYGGNPPPWQQGWRP